MNRDPKKMPEQKQGLPRTTKGPVGECRSTLRLSTGGEEYTELPAKAAPRNYGRESVVRGLPHRFSEMSKGSPSERIGLKCQRCQEEDAAFRVFTDAMDIDVCPSCAEEARQLKITTEDLPEKGQSSSFEKPHYEKQ